MKRVAVIGAGISGIAAAHLLSAQHRVTLIEAQPRIGGHTDTHALRIGEQTVNVDSGFIIFNHLNYPRLSAWLDALNVPSQPTDMSFAVSDRRAGIEYGTANVRALLAGGFNVLRPRFVRMFTDLVRFYREARSLSREDAELTLAEYLQRHRYGAAFRDHHLVPMCAALWSQPPGEAEALPMRHIIEFMTHHRLLELFERPQWRVVRGGSSAYLEAFRQQFNGEILLGTPVRAVVREPGCVRLMLETADGAFGAQRTFDAVFLACHSDQALRLLAVPSDDERAVLGAIGYRRNRIVVHSDPRALPQQRAAWSSWNVVADDVSGRFSVSYWMNRLQSLPVAQPCVVSVDPVMSIREELIHVERDYAHPVFTHEAVRARGRKALIDGVNRTYFCGAYWGFGFHEDGFASAVSAVAAFASQQELHRAA